MSKLTGRWVLFAAILLGVALLVPIVTANGTPGSGAGGGWMPWADSQTGSHHSQAAPHASMHAAHEAGSHQGAQTHQHSADAGHHLHANATSGNATETDRRPRGGHHGGGC